MPVGEEEEEVAEAGLAVSVPGAGAIEDGVAVGAGVAASGREDGSGGESKQRCSSEPQAASGGSGSGGRAQDPGSMAAAQQHRGGVEGRRVPWPGWPPVRGWTPGPGWPPVVRAKLPRRSAHLHHPAMASVARVDLLLQATRGATEGMDGRRARIYGGVGGGGRGREIGRRQRRGNRRKPRTGRTMVGTTPPLHALLHGLIMMVSWCQSTWWLLHSQPVPSVQ